MFVNAAGAATGACVMPKKKPCGRTNKSTIAKGGGLPSSKAERVSMPVSSRRVAPPATQPATQPATSGASGGLRARMLSCVTGVTGGADPDPGPHYYQGPYEVCYIEKEFGKAKLNNFGKIKVQATKDLERCTSVIINGKRLVNKTSDGFLEVLKSEYGSEISGIPTKQLLFPCCQNAKMLLAKFGKEHATEAQSERTGESLTVTLKDGALVYISDTPIRVMLKYNGRLPMHIDVREYEHPVVPAGRAISKFEINRASSHIARSSLTISHEESSLI